MTPAATSPKAQPRAGGREGPRPSSDGLAFARISAARRDTVVLTSMHASAYIAMCTRMHADTDTGGSQPHTHTHVPACRTTRARTQEEGRKVPWKLDGLQSLVQRPCLKDKGLLGFATDQNPPSSEGPWTQTWQGPPPVPPATCSDCNRRRKPALPAPGIASMRPRSKQKSRLDDKAKTVSQNRPVPDSPGPA